MCTYMRVIKVMCFVFVVYAIVLPFIIPPSWVCFCQSNQDWAASQKQNPITVFPPRPSPLIPPWLHVSLHKPLLSSHLSTAQAWQEQEKVAFLIETIDRVLSVCSGICQLNSVCLNLSDPPDPSSAIQDPGLTLITVLHLETPVDWIMH